MTADLLAVLREAREALRSCAWSTELRTDDALMAMATADAKIGEATMMLTVSALRAHEAQGWMPIAEAPKDGRLIATWNPRQPSISRFLRWGTPNLSKDRAWITPKGCAPTYLPTQFLILPPPPETQK